KGARVIHWTQDIYPELPMRLDGMRWLSPLCRLRNREWRQSTACIAIGTDMRDFILRSGVSARRVRVIPNWAPQGLVPATPELIRQRREAWGLNGKFVVAYSGNLGRAHELEVIIALAAELREAAGLIFLFIGEGAQLGRLRAMVEAQRLNNVRFLPPQSRDDLAVTLGAADAHFVTLRPGCEALVFPSKFYGILAVGRPVFYIGPLQTEIARWIREARLGAAFDREDTPAVAAEIKRWQLDPELVARMGRNAVNALPAQGGLASAATLWQELLAAPAEPTSIQAL
ncbi:MAG: glycosyltransferase family 4 protein, partial [Opitutaceae bacterium]|nr:glycosyltransferase family 4 protein [Opitutaceae bacterium]